MTTDPLKVVMVRRGTNEVSNVPSEKLITFISKKVLLGTDELSGDGNNWVRVDQHYQLRKYFLSDGETALEHSVESVSDEYVKLNGPQCLKEDLEEMANLLKDINE